MQTQRGFFRSVCAIAVPVTLQCLLQSSFSVIDQIMLGQLGGVSVAAVGLAGKFSSIYSVIVGAIATVAGIMLSQYLGQSNAPEVRRSFRVNLALSFVLAAAFTLVSLLLPAQLMRLYTQDTGTIYAAAGYLRIASATFLPLAASSMLAALMRCTGRAKLPLYAALAAAACNTLGNYALIFGHFGFAAMGANGAAIATAVSQWLNLLVLLALYPRGKLPKAGANPVRFNTRQYCAMLLPVLSCEFLWSLGENVYAAVYGHLGTDACAAMTLTNPIQSLMIGAMSGLAQAAGVIIGTRLGERREEDAYRESRLLMVYGLAGSLLLSAALIASKGFYVRIYEVSDEIRAMTAQILTAYACIAPVKVLNMILGGGILRSGGRTQLVMWIDLTGTWLFGVPLALMAAFWWKLPVAQVYFLLSLEECVRFTLSVIVFRSRRWMRQLRPVSAAHG